MDGAAKFVRGDAVAGLIIVFVNVIGGMVIGVAQQGMTFGDAANLHDPDRRRRAGVADPGHHRVARRRHHGVQGQYPGSTDKALFKQLGALSGWRSACVALPDDLALLPGRIPMMPF